MVLQVIDRAVVSADSAKTETPPLSLLRIESHLDFIWSPNNIVVSDRALIWIKRATRSQAYFLGAACSAPSSSCPASPPGDIKHVRVRVCILPGGFIDGQRRFSAARS